MPLSEEQTAALQTLAAADPKEVADGLKSVHPDAHQHVFRVGYGTAKGEIAPKVEAATAEAEAARQALEDAKAQLAKAGEGDEATQQRIAALEKAAQEAKDAKTAAEEAAAERIRSVYRSAEDKALLAGLVAAGVDKDYAAGAVLPVNAARVRIDGLADDGPAISYLDADGVTPLSGGRDALVAQLAAAVPAKFKGSAVDAGGGASNGSGGGKSRWEAIKQRAEDRVKDAPASTTKSAAERLGLVGA